VFASPPSRADGSSKLRCPLGADEVAQRERSNHLSRWPVKYTSPSWLHKTSYWVYYQVSYSFAKGIFMTHQILTEVAASISELKANPMKVVASGEGMPIAILNRNEPAFYCVPAKAYEAMMDLIEDKELLEIVKSRMDEESIKVNLDDL
jgi:antitoxin StbD